jgi:hypothetical protein
MFPFSAQSPPPLEAPDVGVDGEQMVLRIGLDQEVAFRLSSFAS